MPNRATGSQREALALDTYVKLLRAVNSLNAQLAPHLARARLTESQFGVLEALLHLGPLHQCDLAQRILKTSGNMTMVVDNLERRGLVRRERSQEDRRFNLVSLTPAGDRLIRAVFPLHATRITNALGVLSEAEQRTLGRLCKRLGLAAAPAEAARGRAAGPGGTLATGR
jgi:MarR family 2-MHQ and catechol resistance regulon transcriptional repressor